jgi:hypothetical protein
MTEPNLRETIGSDTSIEGMNEMNLALFTERNLSTRVIEYISLVDIREF